jgi:2-polyprenyl-6-hydroxyphenyl methylase/3-demethylubiquinone-9 3-methyltransferase
VNTQEFQNPFSFGINWEDYVNNTLDDKIVNSHKGNLLAWLDESDIKNKKILDIGCGSGLSSLCFSLLGGEVYSFDYDKRSVNASKLTKQKFNKDANWIIQQGDVLDKEFMHGLGKYDIVYSWGVLHHTGKIWEAIKNTISARKKNGLVMVSLYTAWGDTERHLATKVKFNNASDEEKEKMINEHIANFWGPNLDFWGPDHPDNGKSRFGTVAPGTSYEELIRKPMNARGMSMYNDAVDWLGGYPFEVAYPDDVISSFNEEGVSLEQWGVEGHYGGWPGIASYLFK